MADIAMPSVHHTRFSWRTVVFTILTGLIALLLLADATPLILSPWVTLGSARPDYHPEIHRWHEALAGFHLGILWAGSLLAVLWRPRARPALLAFVVSEVVLTVLIAIAIGDFEPAALAIVVVAGLLVAAYPAPCALQGLGRRGVVSRPLLGLSALAALALVPYGWRHLQLQLSGVGGEHIVNGHYYDAMLLALLPFLVGALVATKRQGWGVLGMIIGAGFIYLGAAVITLPEQDGSWGVGGGILSVAGGLAFLAATLREAGARPEDAAPQPGTAAA